MNWPVFLSMFSRFAVLQHLAVKMWTDPSKGECFNLDTVMPSVTHLYLLNGTKAILLQTSHHSPAACLPKLQHLVARVSAQCDVANAILHRSSNLSKGE